MAPLAPLVFPPGSPVNWPLHWDEEEEEEEEGEVDEYDTEEEDNNDSLEPSAKRVKKVLYPVLTLIF